MITPHRAVSARCLVVVLLALVGCARAPTQTRWRVKDPRQVVVANPDGAVIMGVGDAHLDLGGDYTLTRGTNGAIEKTCGGCWERYSLLVGPDGQGYSGYGRIRVDRARPVFSYPLRALSVPDAYGRYTSYVIRLETPWTNVEEVTYTRRPWHKLNVAQIATGVALSLAGVAVLGSDDAAARYLGGWPLLGFGGFLVGHGAYEEWIAPGTTRVYP